MKKIKVLHASMMRHPETGIQNQLTFERRAAKELHIPFESSLYVASEQLSSANQIEHSKPRSLWSRFMYRSKERKAYIEYLKAQQKKYDILLLRWSLADPIFVEFILDSSLPVITVHHVVERKELRLRGVEGYGLSVYDDYLFRKASMESSGIVGVTQEILHYEINRAEGGAQDKLNLVYPNGIYWNREFMPSGRIGEKGCPVFIFVASNFSPWQGLDLLLNSTEKIDIPFILHVVGSVDGNLIKKFFQDKRIIFHGPLGQKDLINLYIQSDVGLSPFALERQGLTEACSLKTRDYLRNGLPVFSGHKDVFPSDFPFFHCGNASIEEAVTYWRSVKGNFRLDVANESRRFIDKMVLLKKFYSALSAWAG